MYLYKTHFYEVTENKYIKCIAVNDYAWEFTEKIFKQLKKNKKKTGIQIL